MNAFARLKQLFGSKFVIDEAQEVIDHDEPLGESGDFLPPPSLSVERNRQIYGQRLVPRSEEANAFYHAIIRYGARTGRGSTHETALRMSDLDSELFREILGEVEAERRETVKADLYERIEQKINGIGSTVDTIDEAGVPVDDSTEVSCQEGQP
jgi:hypothetical protein